ncbi:MAG: tetratricopeptide repeat protein [Candidatus Binataceae bacterium]
MTTRSTAGGREPEPPAPAGRTGAPPIFNAERGWLTPADPFLARLGLGDSHVGAWLAALLIAAAALFSRSLGFDFVLDDLDWIGNPYVKHWSFAWISFERDTWWYLDPHHLPQSSYYRPFLNLWAAINFHLFGYHPSGWHATMIVFYLIVVWQVFRVATLLTESRWTGFITAALFALMPTHAESVVWASTICQPLLASFELGAFELYLRRAAGPASDPRRQRRLALSLAMYGGALLSYESAVTFPLLIAVHAFLLRSDRSYAAGVRRAIRAALPYALCGVPYLIVRYSVLGFITRPEMHDPLTRMQAAMSIPGVLTSYLGLLAMPWRAGPEHPVNVVQSVGAPGFYLPAAELIALCAAGFFALRRHPHRRLYLFCAAWFVLTIAAMLNLRGLFAESPIHDRYLYFPSFGVCLMAADLAMSYGLRSDQNLRAVWAGTAAVAIAYAAILFPIEHYWHDNVTLFKRCVEEAPRDAIWHYRLGRTLESQGFLPEARRQLEDTVRLKRDAGGDIYYELGVVDERLGDPKDAERMMAEGIRRVAHPPVVAFTDLAIAANEAGDVAGAEAAFKHAETMPGGVAAAAVTRAQILRLHGDSKGAEQILRPLLAREPNNVRALIAMGMALSDQRRYSEALAAYSRVCALVPKNAKYHYLKAVALHRLGRDDAARRECKIGISLTLDNADIQALLAEIDRSGRAH